MLVKFEQNRMIFLTKTGFFYNYFWQRVDAILEDVSVDEIIV